MIPHDGRGIVFAGGTSGDWVSVRYRGIAGWVHSRHLIQDVASWVQEAPDRSGFLLHIMSICQDMNIGKAYEEIRSKHGSVAAGKQFYLEKTTTKDGVACSRILVGAFQTQHEAEGMCSEMRRSGAEYCSVRAAGGNLIPLN